MPCREGGDERVREAIGMGGAMEGTTRCLRVVGALAREPGKKVCALPSIAARGAGNLAAL